jgi:hypothetical protein
MNPSLSMMTPGRLLCSISWGIPGKNCRKKSSKGSPDQAVGRRAPLTWCVKTFTTDGRSPGDRGELVGRQHLGFRRAQKPRPVVHAKPAPSIAAMAAASNNASRIPDD